MFMGWRRRWMSMHSSQNLRGLWETSLALHLWMTLGSSHHWQWVLALLHLQNREAALLYRVNTLTCSFRAISLLNSRITMLWVVTWKWTEMKEPRKPFIASLMSGPWKTKIHGLTWMINHQTVDQFQTPGSQSPLMTSPSSAQEIIMVLTLFIFSLSINIHLFWVN